MGDKCSNADCNNMRDTGANLCKPCHDEIMRDDYDEYYNLVERANRIPMCFDAWLATGKYDH